MASDNQIQAKNNVGSVVATLDELIPSMRNNATWNESHGANVSPAALRAAADALEEHRDALYAIFQGADDICHVS